MQLKLGEGSFKSDDRKQGCLRAVKKDKIFGWPKEARRYSPYHIDSKIFTSEDTYVQAHL